MPDISALTNVLYEKKDGIAYVTLNRPKVLNALNTPTWIDLKTAFEAAKADTSVHGVILTGAGDKAFIAGADISELAHVDAYEAEESSRFGQDVLSLIENLGKPVVAAINGFALGGGCETAMACTIRIAAEHAKFGQPEVKLGLLPGGGGTQRLPRLVGLAKARDLVYRGRQVPADEALDIGLVDRIAPTADVLGLATQLARSFAEGPSLAYAAAKRALAASDRSLEEGLRIEREAFVALFATRDQEEGMRAFLDKREPRFEGR
jgi:enoyl-CoA hydratase